VKLNNAAQINREKPRKSDSGSSKQGQVQHDIDFITKYDELYVPPENNNAKYPCGIPTAFHGTNLK